MELEKLIELLNDKKFKDFRNAITEEKYVDIAELIEQLDDKNLLLAFLHILFSFYQKYKFQQKNHAQPNSRAQSLFKISAPFKAQGS